VAQNTTFVPRSNDFDVSNPNGCSSIALSSCPVGIFDEAHEVSRYSKTKKGTNVLLTPASNIFRLCHWKDDNTVGASVVAVQDGSWEENKWGDHHRDLWTTNRPEGRRGAKHGPWYASERTLHHDEG
jgi:hypothetical protein